MRLIRKAVARHRILHVRQCPVANLLIERLIPHQRAPLLRCHPPVLAQKALQLTAADEQLVRPRADRRRPAVVQQRIRRRLHQRIFPALKRQQDALRIRRARWQSIQFQQSRPQCPVKAAESDFRRFKAVQRAAKGIIRKRIRAEGMEADGECAHRMPRNHRQMRSAAHVADAAETRLDDASRRFVDVVDEVSADIGDDARRGCASAGNTAPEAANPPLQGFAGQDFMVRRRCEEGSESQRLPHAADVYHSRFSFLIQCFCCRGFRLCGGKKLGFPFAPLTPSVVTFPSQTSRSARRSGR